MSDSPKPAGRWPEVFRVFLQLGLTSFGGPIAHLGYFHRELVQRRAWVSESAYAQLLAICQFLPGPASSQLGFSLGLLRGGWGGALAAFVGFTLPSAVLLVILAAVFPLLPAAVAAALVGGLKLVALAVVAHGVLGMAGRLCPDAPRIAIAALATAVIVVAGTAWVQVLVVLAGAAVGWLACRGVQATAETDLPVFYTPRLGAALIAVFAVLLVGLPLLASLTGGAGAGSVDNAVAVFEAFYRAGALVFGGGHVVLPLLEETVVAPGWMSRDVFLTGYGAAQAVPGPMFSIAAFLGASLPGAAGGVAGASLALVAIFLPGMLLVAGVLPWWQAVARRDGAARAIAGVNAAVVGLLGAALYDPVFTAAVAGPTDIAIAVIGFAILKTRAASALWVVAWCVGAQMALLLV